MIKVSDILPSNDITQMKEESLLNLSKQKHIQEFLKQYHLDTSIMNDYWVELLDYDQDYKTCINCQSLDQCPKDNPGIKKNIVYRDGHVVLELEGCPYSKQWEEKRELLEKFSVCNITDDDLLLTDLSKNALLKKPSLTDNEKRALAFIAKYVKEPQPIGFFLHGDIGTGKTTLLAGLMNALAHKGHQVGFIHFPTYLIDLKTSFSSGTNDNVIEDLMNVDYLLLDGIGEENVTPWSRDEILLTILSYRQINKLPTFFTSMYGYNDLKKVYTIKKGDEIRANTLIAKMKALSNEIMLDGGKIR